MNAAPPNVYKLLPAVESGGAAFRLCPGIRLVSDCTAFDKDFYCAAWDYLIQSVWHSMMIAYGKFLAGGCRAG